MRLSKRRLLGGISSMLGALGISPAMAALQPTPRQTEGPFYPRPQDMLDDRDNDLVRVADAVSQAGGEILHLMGQLNNIQGKPLVNAVVEIWQCDVNGRYRHGADRSSSQPRDIGFQGYGSTTTDAHGTFQFRTIKPAPYPGRTPHIHAKVHHPANGSVLTTQFYVAGDPRNDRDGLYRRLDDAERQRLSMVLHKNAAGDWQTSIKVVI